jgi:NADH:ubiquinone oxidoreductase subunit 2 (subunit N)
MIELELFQIYHLKEMSLSAELFLSCSILQFTFYAISTAYQRKAGFVILNQQVYYIASLLIILSSFLILNEDLLIMNSFSSNNFIINDYFGFITKLTICLTSIAFLTIINVSFRDDPIHNNFEYAVLITISILGLLLLCSSNDLITAYLAIELQSVAFYIMSTFKRDSSYSIESGLKYFIIGALSSAFFLFGSSIVYGCMGSLSFDDLRMFSSLLSSTKVESSIWYASLVPDFLFANPVYSIVALFVPLLDNLIGINLDFDFLYTSLQNYSSYDSGSDSLIDWCCTQEIYTSQFSKINSDPAISTFSIFNSFIDSSTFHLMEGQLNVYDRALLLAQYDFFSSYVTRSFLSYNVWVDLINADRLSLNENLSILKQIFMYYNESSSIGVVQSASSLNLELVSIGFILICISLLIKLAVAPFHFWVLDVYEGSPNTTTAFFAVVPKIGLFVLLMRLCYVSFYQIFESYQTFFFLVSVLSVFVGALGGLEQRKLKTLLAYSSIGHTGYLLLSFSTGNAEGMQMMFYYLSIYMISGLCFWSVYLFLRQKRNFYFNKSNKELGDLVLLKESNPMLALILAMTLFSIAGIPPIVGFLAKIGIFVTVIKSSAYLVAVLSILFSVISTFYYIRVIKILYFENTLVGKLYIPITTQKALLISTLALSLIVLCLDPTILYLVFYKATLLAS